MDLTISLENLENMTVVRTSGDLDAVTCSMLEGALNDLLDKGETRVILDLEGVPYISSAGLRVLLAAAKKLHGTGRFVLSCLKKEVREVLEMTGFTHVMEIHDDLESAKTSILEGS